MMDLAKLPTDNLYKFLSILGVTVIVLSVVVPTGAYWQLQLRKNATQGEVKERSLTRQSLIQEINALEADGKAFWKRSQQKLNEVGMTVEAVRKEIAQQAVGDIEVTQLEAFRTSQHNIATIIAEIEKLETSLQRDESAIHEQEVLLKSTFSQMSQGAPVDVVDAFQKVQFAFQVERELKRLEATAKPDKESIEKKKREVEDATTKAKDTMISVVQIRFDRQNQTKAALLGRMVQGLAQVMVAHFESLRLADLSRESGAQLHAKTTESKIAELRLETKEDEMAIVGRQTGYAIWAGAIGVLLGGCIAGYGFAWWYREDRFASQRKASESKLVEANLKRAESADATPRIIVGDS